MMEITSAASLISSFSKTDAILHIGPGTLSGLTAYPAQEAAVVLVEPDPDACVTLRGKTRNAPNVQVIEAGLRPKAGQYELQRYSLSAFNGFNPPSDVFNLFPGLTKTDRPLVEGVTAADTLATLLETENRDLLIIEAAGAELWVLHELAAAGGLKRFKTIVMRAAARPLFEYAAPLEETLGWLVSQGFDIHLPIGPTDPDLPLICAMRNIRAEALTSNLARVAAQETTRRTAEMTVERARWTKETAADYERRLKEAQKAVERAETEARVAMRKLSEDNSILKQQLTLARAELQRVLEQVDLAQTMLLRDTAT